MLKLAPSLKGLVYSLTMENKTFAIITDIHSNTAALEKALSIIDERNDICLLYTSDAADE